MTETPQADGLEVIDLESDLAFQARHLHARDVQVQMEGLRRLTQAFVEAPASLLQELVDAAVDLCGADSAGVSVQQEDATDANYFRWVATAGEYSRFLNATLPRSPSACSVTLERNRPQIFRVNQRFFDLIGVQAPVVSDGILLPWTADGVRGTIWIMAHDRAEAFDAEDAGMMQTLAHFAAMAVNHQRHQRLILQQNRDASAASMANELAHQINNPLQGLTNLMFLASQGHGDLQTLGVQASTDLKRLSVLVQKLLAIPALAV